jgi:hypothetical protein
MKSHSVSVTVPTIVRDDRASDPPLRTIYNMRGRDVFVEHGQSTR